jgi:hypothetical protein
MRNRLVTSLGIALALVTVLASWAGAEDRRRQAPPSPYLHAQVFALAGRSSGAIGSDLQIDGVTYRVSPDAHLYEIGVGEVPRGTAYYDRVVSVTGLRWHNTLVVYSVTIRPAAVPGMSGTVGIQDDNNSPR